MVHSTGHLSCAMMTLNLEPCSPFGFIGKFQLTLTDEHRPFLRNRCDCDIASGVLLCNCGSYCVIGTCGWLSELIVFGDCRYCFCICLHFANWAEFDQTELRGN